MVRTKEQIEAELKQGIEEMRPLVESINARINNMTPEEQIKNARHILQEGDKAHKEWIQELKEQAKNKRIYNTSFDSLDMTFPEFLRKEGIIADD